MPEDTTTVKKEDQTKLQKGMPTLVGIKVFPRIDLNEMANQILGIEDVEKVFSTVGEFDLVAIVRAFTSAELQTILKNIRQLAGIQATTSFLVLQEFERHLK